MGADGQAHKSRHIQSINLRRIVDVMTLSVSGKAFRSQSQCMLLVLKAIRVQISATRSHVAHMQYKFEMAGVCENICVHIAFVPIR
jgi:hypothetical protein